MAKSWLCIGELSTGFDFRTGEWKAVEFNANNLKVVIREATEDDKKQLALANARERSPQLVTSQLGPSVFEQSCFYSDHNSIECSNRTQELTLQLGSLPFQNYYRPGYVVAIPDSSEGQQEQKGNNPALTIGKCTLIS